MRAPDTLPSYKVLKVGIVEAERKEDKSDFLALTEPYCKEAYEISNQEIGLPSLPHPPS